MHGTLHDALSIHDLFELSFKVIFMIGLIIVNSLITHLTRSSAFEQGIIESGHSIMKGSLPARGISSLILKTFVYQLLPKMKFIFCPVLMLRGYDDTPKLIIH